MNLILICVKETSPNSYNPSNVVAALSSIDNNWYRARIISIKNAEMIEILYLDYGNKEVVPKASLKELDDKFTEFSWMRVKVFLLMKPKPSVDEIHARIKAMMNEEFEVVIIF